MKIKRSKSFKPSPKKRIKVVCNFCQLRLFFSLNIHQSLYRKYSSSQNHFYLNLYQKFSITKLSTDSASQSHNQQLLSKYHRKISRQHLFPQIKQIYKLHKQIPRIFDPQIKGILDKCYHRKRLIEYFKMAKVLGLEVQSVKFSTFLLSLTYHQKDKDLAYQPMIGKISGYQFSDQIERQLLETMEKGQQNRSPNQKLFNK